MKRNLSPHLNGLGMKLAVATDSVASQISFNQLIYLFVAVEKL